MSRRHRYAAEHGHMVRRLLATYAEADAATLAEGREWYSHAERMVAELAAHYGLARSTVAGVVAALSPQRRWRENVAQAETLLERRPVRNAYQANVLKAEAIADGADPLEVLGGPKVRAFFANLIGGREVVTVDVWAQRAATGRDLEAPKWGRYRRIARAYREVAARVGEHPRDFQAIIWLTLRPSTEHAKDKEALEVFA